MKQRVADYIADFLVNNGITDLFTVTGGGAMYLNDAFGHHKKLHCTYNHHEQASAMAAEAYARYSGSIAAVCVTTGPGGINALNGVVGGWLDSIPMFVISGQVKFSTTIVSTSVPLRQLGDQEYNIIDSVKPMTKFAIMVTDGNDIAYYLEKALFVAKRGRPGPVWLDIPLNVQCSVVETAQLRHYDENADSRENPPKITAAQIEAILDSIKNARRPVIFAGEAIRASGSYDSFLSLIEKLNIPVVTAWNAHDVLYDDNPCFCGRPGTIGTRGGNFVAQFSDLLLILGCRLNIRQISYNWENFAPNAYKIMVDIDPGEMMKPTLRIDMPLYADVKDVIDNLENKAKRNTDHDKWLSWANAINKKYPACLPEYEKTESPINPYFFMDKLFDALKEGDDIICGNGSACVCSFQAAKIKKNQRLFTNSGCASMGYGLPAGIGVAVKKQGGRVVCLEGDGSIMMNLQELQTASYNKLNLKIFILNNNGYHSIRQTQTNFFKSPLCGVCDGNGLNFPVWEKIAAAFNMPFVKIDYTSKASEQIRRALEMEGPVLAEAVLDPAQIFSPKLSSRCLPDGTMISSSLEDMFPFLPEEEMKMIKAGAMAI